MRFRKECRHDRHDANLSLVREGIVRWNLQHDTNVPDGGGLAEFLVALLEQAHRL